MVILRCMLSKPTFESVPLHAVATDGGCWKFGLAYQSSVLYIEL